MRILLDLQGCQSTGSRQRGIGRYSMALARALIQEGRQHEFHLLLNAAFPETIETIRENLRGILPAERIHVFRVPSGSAQREVQVAWRTRAAEAIRRCAIQQVAPDFVHVSSLFEGLGDDCAAEVDPYLDGALTAVTVYDFIPWLYPERYLTADTTRAWYRRKLDSLRRATLLLGISASACAEAEAVLPDRQGNVVNVSSAANPDVFSPAAPAGAAQRLGLVRPFVMYTGGIDWRKNIDGLVTAFAELPPSLRSHYQLAIVCDANAQARAHLADHAQRAGLAPADLVLTGYVSDSDLADLYRSCKLFVFPSLHEGFGLPALEALMCGAAVIGSNASSIPEVIGRDDALFDPQSQAAITAALRRALEDDAYWASLKAHAPVQAARFSWKHSARVALDAMEEAERKHRRPPRIDTPQRPRLAMHAPLPPARSGIADYTCELVPALEQYYEIELIHDQPEVVMPVHLRHLRVRDVASFKQNVRSYDRVLYQFGNSSHHAHMFRLLGEVPGAVVLHDFFLSGVLDWMEGIGGISEAFTQALLRSHGMQALEFDRTHGREDAVARYPVNRFVVERAHGVIVHSHWSRRSADLFYGPGYSKEWRLIPHLRSLPRACDRQRARSELGLSADDFVVCSFGHLEPTKLNDRLIEAWHASLLAQDSKCRLVLVGNNAISPYGERLQQMVERSQRISITGYAPRSTYEQYLCAADFAVQLRTMSRGETSGAVLDCFSWGVPLIMNANGSNAEYPAEIACVLPDLFAESELVGALERLRRDHAERQRLRDAGPTWIAQHHDPAAIARQYRDAIETFVAQPQHGAYWNATTAIGALGPAAEHDLAEAAVALEATWTRAPG